MEYVQILPQLFLGSHPQTTDEIERLRQEAGITAVLNLQTDDDRLSASSARESSLPAVTKFVSVLSTPLGTLPLLALTAEARPGHG